MRQKHLFGSIVAAGLLACSSDSGMTVPAPPTPPAPAVLLKEVELSSLPSPYYHFDYDSLKRISAASFASGFTMYKVAYAGGRITEMSNDALGNRDKLEYIYDQTGRVDTVRYVDPNGSVFAIVSLTYKGSQLTGLERRRKINSDFVLEKSMSFSYYADGNLMQIDEHRPTIEGRQTETTTHDRFEQYDDKMNVDGFGLIHDDFFDHLVLLPGVTLQKGNPAKETYTGDGDNFTVAYTYLYDDAGRPITKSGTAVFTSGTDVGRTFQVSSHFTYY
jgi:hypothetical protein